MSDRSRICICSMHQGAGQAGLNMLRSLLGVQAKKKKKKRVRGHDGRRAIAMYVELAVLAVQHRTNKSVLSPSNNAHKAGQKMGCRALCLRACVRVVSVTVCTRICRTIDCASTVPLPTT
jgi:hypothetical protein